MGDEFVTQAVTDGVWHIEDSRGGVVYLVAGTEHAFALEPFEVVTLEATPAEE